MLGPIGFDNDTRLITLSAIIRRWLCCHFTKSSISSAYSHNTTCFRTSKLWSRLWEGNYSLELSINVFLGDSEILYEVIAINMVQSRNLLTPFWLLQYLYVTREIRSIDPNYRAFLSQSQSAIFWHMALKICLLLRLQYSNVNIEITGIDPELQ